MFKRITAVILALLLILMCSCSGQTDKNNSELNSGSENNQNKPSDNPNSVNYVKSQVELLFPTYSPARQIYSVDISELDESTVLFLRQLQGLVAKTQTASVYLVSNDNDKYWLDYLCNELGAYSTKTTVEQLVALYEDSIKTLVMYSSQSDEFSFAWNEAMRHENAVCVEYSVADKFELLYNREVISVCGIFDDDKAAYEAVLGMAELNKSNRVFMALGEKSSFIDYAYACNAYILPEIKDEWSTEFVKKQLSLCAGDDFGIIYTDESVNSAALSIYSTYGFGNIPVENFANSTTFSSISIDYKFEKPKINNGSAKKDKVYLSLVIDCNTAGDMLDKSYLICAAKKDNYSISYEYPLYMSRLAPSTLLWYSVNADQNGDTLIPSGDWIDVDLNSMPEKLIKRWHEVNNYFINKCGMNVAVTDLSVDAESEYLSFMSADGVICYTDAKLNGIYEKSKTPILLAQKMNGLVEFESAINNLSANKESPLYYVFTLSPEEYFEKIPIYDIHNGYYGVGAPDGYYTITEIIAMFMSDSSDFASFISPSQMVAYIKKG